MTLSENARLWLLDLVLLALAIGLFFTIGLGLRAYLTPSEARYIEIPRQILATGDWLTPRINGVPYFEKPPLFYWSQAITFKLFGINEFTGRIAIAKFLLHTCLLSYAIGRLLYGRIAGLLSAGVLATCLLGYGLSRVAMLDVPVSYFVTISLGAFLAAQKTLNIKHQRNWYLLMYAAAALAMLTKGLIGIVIPGLVIGTWILCTKRWSILREARLIPGLILFLLIAAPWHWLMAEKHPDFLNFYFIHEHFTRYLTDEHKRTAPWWFFIAVTFAGLLPWTGLLPAACKKLRTSEPFALFLLLWILLPLVFFSTSHSKLVPYIFPIFPPLAILLGSYLADVWQGFAPSKVLRYNALFILLLFSAALLLYHFVPITNISKKITLDTQIPTKLLLPMLCALTGLAITLLRPRSPKIIIGALGIFAVITDISANSIVAHLDRTSVKPLAEMIAPDLQPDDVVTAYGTYFQDLPVYLNRNITVAGWKGELEFGIYHYPETQKWMITPEQFWQLCAATHQHFYVFTREGMLDDTQSPHNCRLRVLGNYGKTVLLEKQP